MPVNPNYLTYLRGYRPQVASPAMNAGQPAGPTASQQRVLTPEERRRYEENLARRREQASVDLESRARFEASRPQRFTYDNYLSQFQVDPLTELYTGQRYIQPPITREQFEYLDLSDKYGYGQPVNPNEVMQAQRDPYTVGGNIPRTGYAYYQYLQGKLKQDYERQRTEEGARRRNAENIYRQVGYAQFMPSFERERLGITDEDVAADMRRYQQDIAKNTEWEETKERLQREANERNRLEMNRYYDNLQSMATRGFYQTPYAFQNA